MFLFTVSSLVDVSTPHGRNSNPKGYRLLHVTVVTAWASGACPWRRPLTWSVIRWVSELLIASAGAKPRHGSTFDLHIQHIGFTTVRASIGLTKHPISRRNTMYKRTAGIILTGVLATGAIGAVAMTPASATTSDNVVTSRLARIKTALSALVTDGTLTQAQADKVAGTLDSQSPMAGMGGRGGRGGMGGDTAGMGMTQSHDAAAKALGLTSDQLYAAVQGGKSLADVAKDQKVSVDTLVKAMVADANTDLTAAVKAGTLTQAQADTLKSSLTERITDQVNGVRGGGGGGGDGGGGMGRGSRGAGSAATTDGTSGVPSSTPSSTT